MELEIGQRVLDLGAGPGFAAQDLARRVGPGGHVLGLERCQGYVQAGRRLAAAAGLGQLELHIHDLLSDPLPQGEPFDLIWCRWVLMVLAELSPLLDQLHAVLRPGGRLLVHESMQWDTFALHPHGQAVRRFGQVVQHSFRAAGGDPGCFWVGPLVLELRATRPVG